MTLQPGLQLSHYRLVEKLGEGGMGVVWRAIDTHLDREIALKLLPEHLAADPVRLLRFEREAKAVAALNHPNIITIHSVEEAEGRRFLTLELVRGRTLDLLIPEGGMPLPLLLRIAAPLAAALAAAHERGVAHRDLKPSNVMVTDEGRVKVLDFGLAESVPRGLKETSEATTVSRSVGFAGTLAYMSPEQLRGLPVDPRSDVFSLGTLLYEMACGRRPFGGATSADLIAAVLRDPAPPVGGARPDLPAELGALIERCLEKDPARRPAPTAAVHDALQRLTRSAELPRDEFPLSIAVLPFADLSAERDQDYLCEGIAEEILNALAQVRGLRVASRSAAFPLSQAKLGSREVGRRLRVATLLQGSVRKAGDRLRITVELTDVAEDRQIWSERFERDATDIFAIQDEMAQRVVRALALRFHLEEQGEMQRAQTTDVPAYLCYLRGRKFFFEYRRRSIEFALQTFQRAIDHDPRYALAYAGIADCAAFLYQNVGRRDEDRRRAEAASLKALELGPDLAVAHSARAVALTLFDRHDEADAEFGIARRLDPALFEAYYFDARASFTRGLLDRAARLYERASEVRPEDYQAPLLVAQIYDDLGREFAAEATRRRGLRIAEERLELNPDDARALYMMANALVALGERERGLDACRRALEIDPQDPMLLYNVACVRSLAGQIEPALDALEQGVRTGLLFREWVAMDSNLDPLRSHPRFQGILDLLGDR